VIICIGGQRYRVAWPIPGSARPAALIVLEDFATYGGFWARDRDRRLRAMRK